MPRPDPTSDGADAGGGVKIANLALLPALAAEAGAEVVAPGTSCRHQVHDLAGRRALHPLQVIERQLPAQ